MITELTAEQEAQLKIYAEKWRNIAFSTEPANRSEAEQGIYLAYQNVTLNPPNQIIWCNSPNAIYDSINVMKAYGLGKRIAKRVRESIPRIPYNGERQHQFLTRLSTKMGEYYGGASQYQILPLLWRELGGYSDNIIVGQHNLIHAGVDDFCCSVLDYKISPMQQIMHTVNASLGWWYPYETYCFASERHSILNLDNEDNPHCEDGLAIGYPDGWGVYAWHGVRVPEWVIMQPQDITPDKIMSEQNAEISRVMLERYGQDNFIRDGGFSKVQSDDYGELYRIEFDNEDEPIVAVKVQDASTDREYFLYVPPHIRSAHEGVAWTFGYDNVNDYQPKKET